MLYRLRRFLAELNPLIATCALLLLALGWTLVLSATLPTDQTTAWPLPLYAERQAVWIGLGLVGLVAAASIDYHVLLRLAPWIYGGGLFLLALVLGIGHTSFGARRWFVLGKVFVQPGEFVKLGVLLFVAGHAAAARAPEGPRRRLVPRWLPPSLLMVAVPFVLIAFQPNLGTATLLLVSASAIWFAAGAPWGLFAGALGTVGAAAPFVWVALKDYQRARILNFLNPYRDPLGGGYTVIQSVTAIGSGGLWGRGFLLGPQNRLQFTPKHHTDFIVSVLGEEFGWAGCAALLLVYLLLYLEGLRVAHRARDTAGTYLATGIVALLACQTLVNLGMNVGIVPVTGLPLPLVSYGGSSLLIACGLVGIMLNVGRQRRR